MQIVHDSSGKKKPMQVVDDGKETKLKKFDGVAVPEQEVQDNSEVEEVIDDTQAVHDEQKTESMPTETETETEEQVDVEETVEKPKKKTILRHNIFFKLYSSLKILDSIKITDMIKREFIIVFFKVKLELKTFFFKITF